MTKIIFTILLSILLGATSPKTVAFIIPDPKRCPTPQELQAVGVSKNAVQDFDGLWFTGRRNQSYGTGSDWTFIVGKIDAIDRLDAYSKGSLTVNALKTYFGPIMGPMGKWICYYIPSNSTPYRAVTVNPPIAMNNFRDYLIQ